MEKFNLIFIIGKIVCFVYCLSLKILICLLYTSDAADERSSVDLGGRRIIKKKNTKSLATDKTYQTIT